nr:Ig-like domain-containing protein [uncultured Celeribacter sp.]
MSIATPFTAANIQATCGFVSVSNVIQDGADISYASDDYYGLSFRAVHPDGNTYDYTIAVDTGTALINTRTPVDTTSPSVTLSSTTTTLTGTDPFTVTATFDEDVTGFDDLANDVTITNGTVTAIAGGPSVYTLTITPTGAGDVEISVPASAAEDAAANDNTASNTLVIGDQTVEVTQEAIAGFMLGRANNLASNQPGLTRFLMGDGCGAFNANAAEGSGSIDGCVSRGNTWAEITSAWSGDDGYTLASFGAHGFVNPNLLIGGMLQFDRAEESASNATGNGWMMGPYFVAKAPDQRLFFEGRLLYGQTDNTISPLGTYTDSFETERWLTQLRATGEYQHQNTTLMPLLDFTYTDDTQRAYTDSLGNAIPGQTVSLMQLTAGVDFSTPIPAQTGALELTGGLSGIYSSTDGAAASPEFENWRGRTHLGLNYDTGRGATARVGAFYDGLGTDYESYGADIGLDWTF